MLPEVVMESAILGDVNLKSICSEPLLCDAGNGRELCCRARGSTKPQVDARVANVPSCLLSRVGTPSLYVRGCELAGTSGLYVRLASITKIISLLLF